MWKFITEHHQELSVIANCFVAIGTIGAVIVGIFGNRIRAWFIKPKLEVDFRFNAPDNTEVDMPSSSDQKHHKREYYIKVLNNGRAIASNCQLVIDELYKQRRDGNEYVLEKNFFSAPLSWFNKANSLSNIGKGMSLYVNWLAINEFTDVNEDSNSMDTSSTSNLISVLLRFANNDNSYSLSPGTYVFEIKTCADNIDPIFNCVEIFLAPSCTWKELDSPQKFMIKTISKRDFVKRCGGKK